MCIYDFVSFVDDFAPDELEIGVRELILKDLETFIRRQFPGKYKDLTVPISASMQG